MAQNSLSPGFVKLFYSVAGRPHKQILPVLPATVYEPGTLPSSVRFQLGDNIAQITFAAAMDAYDDILDDGLNTTDGNITLAEFWQQPLVTDDPQFVSVYEIGHAGASATATVPYSQRTTTFRTSLGGYYKNVVLDQVNPVNVEDAYPFAAGVALNLYNFLTDPTTNFIRGRDGGFIVSGINTVTKTNDALRKKYLLNA
jgi:hypothetical protein